MYLTNKSSTLNVRQYQPTIHHSQTENLRKRVTCVTNASTITKPFIEDFLCDIIPDKAYSSSVGSTDSPMYYGSTSSNNDNYCPHKLLETKQTNVTSNSLFETTKSDNLNSSTSDTSGNLMSLKSPIKPLQKVSNTTTSETFGFLFALDNFKNISQMRIEDERDDMNEMKQFHEETPSYYSNLLLSSRNKTLRKVNFNFQKPKMDKPLIVESKKNLMTPITNRQVISFVYPSVIPVNNDLNSNNLIKTEITKLVSVASDKPANNDVELKRDTFLQLTAEGDTFDSYSDLIKIYPNMEHSKSLSRQPVYFAYPKDLTPTPSHLTTEMTKNKYLIQSESIKPQKIFSQIHHNLNDVKRISKKSYKEFKDHSIVTIKFFHKSLALGEY